MSRRFQCSIPVLLSFSASVCPIALLALSPVAAASVQVPSRRAPIAAHKRSLLPTSSPPRAARHRLAQLFVGNINHMVASDPTAGTSPMPTLDTYWKTLDQIQGAFYNPDVTSKPDDSALTYAAIRGVLSSLNDPYTRFLAPAQFAEMQRENRGTFPGIGVELRAQDNKIFIDRVIPDSPASKAGIAPNDQLLKVNGADVSGKTTDAVGTMLKGEEGTSVSLVVQHGAAPETLTLIRKEVSYPHFESKIMDGNIGYMHLLMFDEQAADNIGRALDDFRKAGVKGIIFDLRDNPGGLLTAAVDVASKFIPPGPVVYVQERGGQRNALPTNSDATNNLHLPFVVLVNHYSASASEIVSGAIQDTHSAPIIGLKTWGKGLVQEIIPLSDDSAIALTTAHYYTPSGADINLKGIEPDIVVGKLVPEPDDPSDTAQAAYNAEVDKVNTEQLNRAILVLKDKMAAPRVVALKP